MLCEATNGFPRGVDATPLLEIINADIGYGTLKLLTQVDISVHKGEVIGLVGSNGSGKSTLLKVIVGFAELLAGKVIVKGCDISNGLSTDEVCRKHRVAYLAQGRRVVENISVEDNLSLAVWDHGSEPSRIKAINKLLDTKYFSGLRSLRGRTAGLLSGGQRLQLSLAMLTLRDADLYLVDEPSAGADVEALEVARGVITCLANKGAAVIVVEQRLSFLEQISTRYLESVPHSSVSSDTLELTSPVNTIVTTLSINEKKGF